MMMTILPPQERRRRRRRRLGLGGLAGAVLLATVGAWAAAQAHGRYLVLVVDSETGEVVSRTGAEGLKLPQGPRVDWRGMVDGLLRSAAGGLADRLQTYADEGAGPARATPEAAPPVLAGGPPPRGLRIQITDAWAAPDAVLAEGGGG